MFEWIHDLAAWLQGWMSAEAGLWGLGLSAFVSATVLPGSSEIVMSALVTAYPHLVWAAFAVATAGNVLGCVLTYGMGYAGREGYARFQKVRAEVDLDSPNARRLQRWGPPALFLAFLPLVGDALCWPPAGSRCRSGRAWRGWPPARARATSCWRCRCWAC
jgi:membrane protein YqaA with SNARE-associated domain